MAYLVHPELSTGLQTMSTLYGALGMQWQEQVDQWAHEAAYQTAALKAAAAEQGVTLNEIFATRSGGSVALDSPPPQ